MKDFIYILVTLILTGFSIGVTYLQARYGQIWFSLYLPIVFMWGFWMDALVKEYSSKNKKQ